MAAVESAPVVMRVVAAADEGEAILFPSVTFIREAKAAKKAKDLIFIIKRGYRQYCKNMFLMR